MDDTQKQIRELILKADPANPLQYIKNTVKDLFIEKINQAIIECDDCEGCDKKVKSIGYGNPNATLMIISESVREEQITLDKKTVYPFEQTKEEKLLNQMLEYYCLNKDEIFFVNALNCFPCTKTNTGIIEKLPGKKQLTNCKLFLNNFIEAVNPVAILLLGATTLNVFQKESMQKAHGKMIDINGYPGIATYSLSYLLTMKEFDPTCFQEFKQDISDLLQYIKREFPNNKLIMKG